MFIIIISIELKSSLLESLNEYSISYQLEEDPNLVCVTFLDPNYKCFQFFDATEKKKVKEIVPLQEEKKTQKSLE